MQEWVGRVRIEEGRAGDHCEVGFSAPSQYFRRSIGEGAYDLDCSVPRAGCEGVFGY